MALNSGSAVGQLLPDLLVARSAAQFGWGSVPFPGLCRPALPCFARRGLASGTREAQVRSAWVRHRGSRSWRRLRPSGTAQLVPPSRLAVRHLVRCGCGGGSLFLGGASTTLGVRRPWLLHFCPLRGWCGPGLFPPPAAGAFSPPQAGGGQYVGAFLTICLLQSLHMSRLSLGFLCSISSPSKPCF